MSSSTDRSDAWIVWLSCEFCGRSICSFCTLFSLNALCQEKHLSQNTLNFQRKSKVVSNLLDIFAAYAHSWRAAPGEALLNPNMSVQWCSHPNLKKKTNQTKNKCKWKMKNKCSSSQRYKASFFLWRDSKISLWISQFSNEVGLNWLPWVWFILLKTIMEPLLWYLGNYIFLETKSKMNEQREAQKRAGASGHSEPSGNLLSMATLLNTHFPGR